MNNTVLRLTAPGTITADTVELPPPGQGFVRVRLLYCGVCGSDISHYRGLRQVEFPVSMGHEFVARVERVGRDVSVVGEGDLVTSDLNYRCGSCVPCRKQRSHLCVEGQCGMFSNRGFSQYSTVHATYLHLLPEFAGHRFALVEPLSCVLHAISWAEPKAEESVLVLGCGGLGLCVAYALSNSLPKLHFDISDLNRSREAALCGASGARPAREGSELDYDVVFDVSGSLEGLTRAVGRIAPGGRLCTLSHLDGRHGWTSLLEPLLRRDVAVKMSYLNGERGNIAKAVDLLTRCWTDEWEALLSVHPASQLSEVLGTAERAPANKSIISLADDHFY